MQAPAQIQIVSESVCVYGVRGMTWGFLPRTAQLGGRKEVAGEQVEEAGNANQACEDAEPQWQVL